MARTKNSNTINKVSVDAKALTRANKYLAATGYRICRYTGELLRLTEKNFYRNENDSTGFEQMSKKGKALFNQGRLRAATKDTFYLKNNDSTTELL